MLSPKVTAALFNFILLASAAPGKRQSTGTGSCTDIHMFLARGYDETYPGRQQSLVDDTCDGLASCDYEDIIFDATNPRGWNYAMQEGQSSGLKQIKAYAQKCPQTKLVVSGYSEGAQIVGNVLADPSLAPISPPGNKLCAGLLFGDPTHVANQPYNVEAGSRFSAQMPRSGFSLLSLNRWSGVLRSWCNGNDTICATTSGLQFVEEYHTNYFQLYSNDGASFIKDKCKPKAAPPSPTPTPSPTSCDAPSPTATGSVCVGGQVKAGLSDNYSGLCAFSCAYGYCPDAVCECTTTGTQAPTPADGDGSDGCPADGLDDSYKGLCSYSCSHGYCPAGACKTC